MKTAINSYNKLKDKNLDTRAYLITQNISVKSVKRNYFNDEVLRLAFMHSRRFNLLCIHPFYSSLYLRPKRPRACRQRAFISARKIRIRFVFSSE